LVIGQGASGLISELLKHPVVTIDYVELDPAIMDMFRVYRFGLTQKELNNKRLNLINQDARLYLRAHPQRYDVILVGLANQADLATNRFFTREFFLLAKEKLNPQGIFSFWLEGSLTYINQELKDINGCIFNSLKAAFRDIRIVPGDYNIFIAGKSAGIADIDAQEVWRRKIEQGIETAYLQYNYLAYRMDRGTLNWFRKALRSATAKSNRDLMPFAVFKMMQLNNKKFSPRIGAFFAFFEKVNLKNILLLILSVTLALACFLKRLRRQEFCLAYGIFTSGFFGLLSTLILIFSYQVFYSRLYHKIGILISVFMAGAAFGSLFIGRRPAALNNPFKLFIRLDFLVAAFSLFLGLLLTGAGRFPLHFAGFTFLFFCSGLFIGLQFPLANKIFLRDEGGVGRAAGLLYAADLLGGCLAGMFTGIVFLPLLGVLNTCLLAFALKLSSAFLLVISRKS
jgi:spermidine synthase